MNETDKALFMMALLSGQTSSDAIIQEEKRNQGLVCSKKMLPKRMIDSSVPKEEFANVPKYPAPNHFEEFYKVVDSYTRNWYNSLGIKIIDDSNSALYQVELPEGWKLEPTDHDMWSTLKDANGTLVADVFVKMTFGFGEATLYPK